MPIVSFAQNFEDVLLWRALGDIEKGCYLDIGAQDPVIDSVSLAFYNAGWRGVHVEASPIYAELLRKARSDETVIEAAVTDAEGPIPFFSFDGTGLSTGISDVADSHRDHGHEYNEIYVPTVTLEHVLNATNRDIHWLKIDVEAMEPEVLRSWGSSEVRPWVLLIESTVPLTQTPNENLWMSEVVRRGYDEVFFDGLNRFFVHTSHKDLAGQFSAPVNFFDGFAIGKNHFAASFLCDDQKAESARIDDADAANDKAEIFRLHGAIHALNLTESELRAALGQARAEREAIRLELTQLHEHSRNAVETAWKERSAHENALRAEFKARDDRAADDRAEISRLHGAIHGLKITESELRAVLDQARTGREIIRLELMQLHEHSRNAVETAWRDRSAHETALRIEYLTREDHVVEALRIASANESAAKIQLAQAERQLSESQHSAARERAEFQLAAAREQLTLQERALSERLEYEDAVRQEYQRKEANAAEMLRVAHANHTKSQTDLVRNEERLREALERLEQVGNEREKTHSLLEASKQLESSALAQADRLERELRIEIIEAVGEGERTASELRVQLSKAESHLDGVTGQLDAATLSIRKLLEERRSPWKLIALFLNPVMRNEGSGFTFHPTPAQPWLRSGPRIHITTGISEVGRNMLIYSPDARNPYLRAESLLQLLAWDDRDFVCCSYVTILGRQPDEHEENYYTELIRTGRSKLHILRQLRLSHEGTDHDPGIAGLDRALRKAHREQLPLIGALVRFFTGGERDDISSQKIRALMNEMARVRIFQQETQAELRAAGQGQQESTGQVFQLISDLEKILSENRNEHKEFAAGVWQMMSSFEKILSDASNEHQEFAGGVWQMMSSFEKILLDARNGHKEFATRIWQVMGSFEKILLDARNDVAGVSSAQKDLAENVLRFMANFEDALKPRPQDRVAAETRLTPKAQKLYDRLVSR